MVFTFTSPPLPSSAPDATPHFAPLEDVTAGTTGYASETGCAVIETGSDASKRFPGGFLDEPLTRIEAIDGEPRGLREILKLSARILDDVRAAGSAMVPIHDPEAAAPAAPGDGAEGEDDGAKAAAGDEGLVTDTSRMPRGGCPERMRLACESCGQRGAVPLATQPEFHLRGVERALAD